MAARKKDKTLPEKLMVIIDHLFISYESSGEDIPVSLKEYVSSHLFKSISYDFDNDKISSNDIYLHCKEALPFLQEQLLSKETLLLLDLIRKKYSDYVSKTDALVSIDEGVVSAMKDLALKYNCIITERPKEILYKKDNFSIIVSNVSPYTVFVQGSISFEEGDPSYEKLLLVEGFINITRDYMMKRSLDELGSEG